MKKYTNNTSMSSYFSKSRPMHGFTLVELLVTITVAGILVAVAAPALGTFVSRSVIRGLSTDFSVGVQKARSEAINRNECVVMCMSANVGTVTTGVPSCATTGQNWSTGWIIFRYPACVPNASGNYPVGAALDIFVRREAVAARYDFVSPSNTRAIVFNSRGLSSLASGGSFNLKDSAAGADQKFERTLCVSGLGRVRTIAYAASC